MFLGRTRIETRGLEFILFFDGLCFGVFTFLVQFKASPVSKRTRHMFGIFRKRAIQAQEQAKAHPTQAQTQVDFHANSHGNENENENENDPFKTNSYESPTLIPQAMGLETISAYQVLRDYRQVQSQDPRGSQESSSSSRVTPKKPLPGTEMGFKTGGQESESKTDPRMGMDQGTDKDSQSDSIKTILVTQHMIDLKDAETITVSAIKSTSNATLVSTQAYVTENNAEVASNDQNLSSHVWAWNGVTRLLVTPQTIETEWKAWVGTNPTNQTMSLSRLCCSIAGVRLFLRRINATSLESFSLATSLIGIEGATCTANILVGNGLKAELERMVSDSKLEQELLSSFYTNVPGTETKPATMRPENVGLFQQQVTGITGQYIGPYASSWPGSRSEPVSEPLFFDVTYDQTVGTSIPVLTAIKTNGVLSFKPEITTRTSKTVPQVNASLSTINTQDGEVEIPVLAMILVDVNEDLVQAIYKTHATGMQSSSLWAMNMAFEATVLVTKD